MPVFFAAATEHAGVLLSLFLMIFAAKVMAEIFERLRQPAVVGEILAGVLIGPSILGWVSPTQYTTLIAEFGVIFLLFAVGLETKPESILRVGKRAFMVGTLGVVLPFVAGYFIAIWWDGVFVEAMFFLVPAEFAEGDVRRCPAEKDAMSVDFAGKSRMVWPKSPLVPAKRAATSGSISASSASEARTNFWKAVTA